MNRIVPHGSALDEALRWGARLTQGPAAAQARIKQLVHAARGRSRRAQLDAERDAFVASLYGDECGEGIRAFLEKRPPRYRSGFDNGSQRAAADSDTESQP